MKIVCPTVAMMTDIPIKISARGERNTVATNSGTLAACAFLSTDHIHALFVSGALGLTKAPAQRSEKAWIPSEPPLGIEPRTYALRKHRSATELRRRPKDAGYLFEIEAPVKRDWGTL
jgi:hypothetical protein